MPGTFLAHLSPDERAGLLAAGARRRHRAGTTLLHHGDPSRHVLVIETGWVKITMTGRHGWEALLAVRGPGDVIGELSAVDAEPRMATVTSLTELTVVVLPAESFERHLRDHWPVARALIRHLGAHLRESDRRRAQHGQSNGDARLAAMLHELLTRHGVPAADGVLIDLPLSQKELASAVGVSREVAARTMRLLRERQIVTTHRRRIVVRRPDLLASLARSVSMSAEGR
ncbi:Crp/Fnr family transcriptional regulator [Paractinoplanes atraurantiacus]|uniref:cAMP-binding domain of CRP or a regulatory subunit of cAMP-dependent protein kinases n=1 Tax=Paractinoplanes atraurantiacus TaxID=1036182 RepID=A0A285J5B2_9ACTN|nr:Crp/Fnr family transcriptional regulator [Actinoplanes atraurantiacus]SNY55398.1 cAMP-binding domain of CRP or a regulatory subunit of cAMP-dependent protein kinases [Actinoplanes atraurantiacus]